jgi:two-component system, sensor histidine kinase and response regulator
VNILIVDDQPTNLKLLQAQLRAAGHTVIPALDGVQALDVLRQQKVDAVISDILMPRMDGYRLCYEVRKSAQWHALPFIFFTATYTSPADEKLCFDLGADKYLRKPCSMEELVAALRDAVSVTARGGYRRDASLSGPDVMQEYNQRLVAKLEEKQIELQRVLHDLQSAHEQILGLNRDLERRVGERTLELEAANKELEAFSYSVSHDLRAPLRSIDGFLQLFRKEFAGRLPQDADAQLERVHEQAVFMGRLIEGLLALSRFGRAPLRKQHLAPAAIVQQALEQLRPDLERRNVQLSVGELPEAHADPTLLQQVFVNLLSNAIKYTRQRDPAIIEVGWREEQGEGAYFVRDNGAGFAMDDAKRLFGVFERLHDSTEFEGIGVGLSIVKRIVERHGGRVWAESEPNKGATFRFTLGASPPRPV